MKFRCQMIYLIYIGIVIYSLRQMENEESFIDAK